MLLFRGEKGVYMLVTKCDICGTDIPPTIEEDSNSGYFRLIVDDFTKYTPGGHYYDRKHLDICPCCFSQAMNGVTGSFVLRKLIGPNDWNKIGHIVN